MYKISYTGDGEALQFAFAFPFFQPDDVRVALDEVLLDASQYNLQYAEDLSGGTITFATAPDAGVRIDIFRKINLSRFIDYQPVAKIDPENLNADFNFLLEAFRDLNAIDMDLTQWKNIHDNVIRQMEAIKELIEDKTGAAPLGLYNNLLAVLSTALPRMISDYGLVSESAEENIDDYGTV
ncbi:MAG: hypothetical protein FWF97_03070 [Alphaproteobacteria bacterium]|nr:hypothetical protein [Alphaproteobacteria bacterium]